MFSRGREFQQTEFLWQQIHGLLKVPRLFDSLLPCFRRNTLWVYLCWEELRHARVSLWTPRPVKEKHVTPIIAKTKVSGSPTLYCKNKRFCIDYKITEYILNFSYLCVKYLCLYVGQVSQSQRQYLISQKLHNSFHVFFSCRFHISVIKLH